MNDYFFDQLQFKPHPAGLDGKLAQMKFPNGYGISVVSGHYFYTSPGKPYEVAVVHDGKLCYDTPLTNDVIGHQTEEEVSALMNAIAELPERDSNGR